MRMTARIVMSAALLLAGAPVGAMPMRGTVLIVNSGSTNMIGFRIMLGAGTTASYASGAGTGYGEIPVRLAARFRRDIALARPLAALPPGPCAKSVSFGTRTFITVGGDRSPDISCGDELRLRALSDDVMRIAQSLHVTNVPRSRGRELPPLNF